MQKRIYLGCPYTHNDPEIMEQRAKIATVVAGYFMKKYNYAVFSPITHGHEICKYGVKPDFTAWQKTDLSIIKNWATEFYYLPLAGYEHSKGLQEELKFARKNGLVIVEIGEPLIDAVCEFLGYER